MTKSLTHTTLPSKLFVPIRKIIYIARCDGIWRHLCAASKAPCMKNRPSVMGSGVPWRQCSPQDSPSHRRHNKACFLTWWLTMLASTPWVNFTICISFSGLYGFLVQKRKLSNFGLYPPDSSKRACLTAEPSASALVESSRFTKQMTH